MFCPNCSHPMVSGEYKNPNICHEFVSPGTVLVDFGYTCMHCFHYVFVGQKVAYPIKVAIAAQRA